MTVTEVASKRDRTADDCDEAAPSLPPETRAATTRRMQIRPFLITLAAAALAGLLGWAMWDAYMGAPWTRDATVRAYVVTMAPEVAGRIVELTVRDNQFVHKDDLLMEIDPTNYKIAVSQAEASVQQAQANVQNIDAQMDVQQAQIRASQAQLDEAQAALVFAQQQSGRYKTLAQDGSSSLQNAQQFTSQLHQQQDAGKDCIGKSQPGAAASRVAEGATPECRGDCRSSQGPAPTRRR